MKKYSNDSNFTLNWQVLFELWVSKNGTVGDDSRMGLPQITLVSKDNLSVKSLSFLNLNI